MSKPTFHRSAFLVAAFFVTSVMFSQQSYTFTNAGQTGTTGPTQAQVNNSYTNTNLGGSVTVNPQGIQNFTIPVTGGYRIQAYGAQGYGSFGGRGAYMSGDFTLTAGTVLKILVGQQGIIPTGGTNQYGGGGGSFITYTNNVPLVVAGGGGGSWASNFTAVTDGTTSTTGNSGANGPAANGSGGTNGLGGSAASLANGGAGIYGNGGGTSPAMSFTNGGNGGGTTGRGGFGGGGGASSQNNRRSGGGGGYSGGGGSAASSSSSGNPEGGGGGSYNNGINQVNAAGTNTGHGRVIITELCSITLTGLGINASNAICAGSSVTITTNAISNYSWSTGATTSSLVVSPAATTVYSLTATSASNCVAAKSITIFVNASVPSLTVTNSASANAGGVCPAKSVTITASGASTYTWTGANSFTNGIAFVPIQASGYTVTGENACGTSTAATSVSIHTSPVVGATVSQPTLCSGLTVTFTGTGNANSYSWSGGVTNGVAYAPSVSGNFTVTGTSVRGCTAIAVAAVTVVTTPLLAPVLSTVSICNGGQATITASGATNYTWLPMNTNASSIVVNPVSPTTYTIIKSNANCVDTKTVALHVNQQPPIFAVTNIATVCANNPATLTAGGGISYTWAPVGGKQYTAVVAPAVNTIYTVAASDGSCIGTSTVLVATDPNPVIVIAASSSVICEGESVTMTLSGALNYTWTQAGLTGSNVIVSPTVPTLYQVTGDNSFGCTSIQQQIVLVNPLPPTSASMTKTLVCSTFPATVSATGAHTYSWSTGVQSASTIVYPVATTVYSVTGTYTTTGCVRTKTIQVAVFEPTFATSSHTAICAGGSILLTASGASGYTWTGHAPGLANVMVSPASASVYTVTANSWSPNNYVSCLSSKTVSVGIYSNPTITAVAQRTLICRYEKVELTGGGGASYAWSHGLPSGGTVVVSPLAETRYTVTGTDIYNCVNTATVLVRVSACPGFAENAAAQSGLSVYPNPNDGSFVIRSQEAIELQLRNELGQVIGTFLLDGSNNYQADLKELSAGIYFVTGRHNGSNISQKVVVSR